MEDAGYLGGCTSVDVSPEFGGCRIPNRTRSPNCFGGGVVARSGAALIICAMQASETTSGVEDVMTILPTVAIH